MKISLCLAALLALTQMAHAQPKTAPRLIGSATSSGDVFIAGGYSKQKGWFSDQTARRLALPGTKWQLVGLGGHSQITTGKVEAGEGVGGFVARSTRANAGKSEISTAATDEVLALANVPNAQPRRLVQAQSLQAPLYADEAKKLLSRAGLKLKTAKLTQLLRVDLNGDGQDEALFCARSRPDFGKTPETRVGDYNLVALRCLVGGKLKVLPLMVETNTKAARFGAPNRSEVLSCADIDGDGKMEIVVSTGYYEGWGLEVWRFEGKSVKRVLEAGWGA